MVSHPSFCQAKMQQPSLVSVDTPWQLHQAVSPAAWDHWAQSPCRTQQGCSASQYLGPGHLYLGSHSISRRPSAICSAWLIPQCSNHTKEAPARVGAHQKMVFLGPTRFSLIPASSLSPSPTSARLRRQMVILTGKAPTRHLRQGMSVEEEKETISFYPLLFSVVWKLDLCHKPI